MICLEEKNDLFIYAIEDSGEETLNKENIQNGRISLGQLLVVGTTGVGKSATVHSIVYQLQKRGATVIYLTEKPGNEFDAGFWCIPPDKKWQINLIERQNLPLPTLRELKDKVRFYHPLSTSEEIPFKKKYFPINFYSFSLKDLDEISLSALLGVERDKDPIKVCYKNLKKLKDEDDISIFLHKIFKSIYKETTRNTSIFGLPLEDIGNKLIIKKINDSFESFSEHYFLHPETSETNLKYIDILNDNSHIHVFSTKWLQEKRLNYFVAICLLFNFKRVLEKRQNKYPVIFILEEMQSFLPDSQRVSYEDGFLDLIKEYLAIGRALGGRKGKGGTSIIATSQNYYMVAKAFRSNCNNKFLLKLSSEDIEHFKKAAMFDKKEIDCLSSLEIGEFIWWTRNELVPFVDQKYIPFIAPFKLSEVGDDFLDFYSKYYKEELRDHKGVYISLRELKNKHLKMARSRYGELMEIYSMKFEKKNKSITSGKGKVPRDDLYDSFDKRRESLLPKKQRKENSLDKNELDLSEIEEFEDVVNPTKSKKTRFTHSSNNKYNQKKVAARNEFFLKDLYENELKEFDSEEIKNWDEIAKKAESKNLELTDDLKLDERSNRLDRIRKEEYRQKRMNRLLKKDKYDKSTFFSKVKQKNAKTKDIEPNNEELLKGLGLHSKKSRN